MNMTQCNSGGGGGSKGLVLTKDVAIRRFLDALLSVKSDWRKIDDALMANPPNVEDVAPGASDRIIEVCRYGVEMSIEPLEKVHLPALLPYCDEELRQRIRQFVASLDPGQEAEDCTGDRSMRWRQTWDATGLDLPLSEIFDQLWDLLSEEAKTSVNEDYGLSTGGPEPTTPVQSRGRGKAIGRKEIWAVMDSVKTNPQITYEALALEVGVKKSTLAANPTVKSIKEAAKKMQVDGAAVNSRRVFRIEGGGFEAIQPESLEF